MSKARTSQGRRRWLMIVALFSLLLAQAIVMILICGGYLGNARGIVSPVWEEKSSGRHDDIDVGYGPVIVLFSGTAAFMSMVALFLLVCGLFRQDEEIQEQKEQNIKFNRDRKIKMLMEMSAEFHSCVFLVKFENAKMVLAYLRPITGRAAASHMAPTPQDGEGARRAYEVFQALCKWMAQGIVNEAIDKISVLIPTEDDDRDRHRKASDATKGRALDLFADFVSCMNFLSNYCAVLLGEDPPIQEFDFFRSHWEAIRSPVMHLVNESAKGMNDDGYNFYQLNFLKIDEYYRSCSRAVAH